MNGGSGGVVVLIIIGIVLNMIIKAMRAKQKKPPVRRPAPRPNLGQEVERPLDDRPRADLMQEVERPLADRPRPQAPHTPLAPQPAPQVRDVRPAAEKRDLTMGVSLEGTSLEGPTLEGVSLEGKARSAEPDMVSPTGMRIADGHSIKGWFRDGGVVRGIVMSEILNPPVSRRR